MNLITVRSYSDKVVDDGRQRKNGVGGEKEPLSL